MGHPPARIPTSIGPDPIPPISRGIPNMSPDRTTPKIRGALKRWDSNPEVLPDSPPRQIALQTDGTPQARQFPQTDGPPRPTMDSTPLPPPFTQPSLPQPRELPPGRLPNGLEPPERTPRPDRPRARDRPKPRRRPRPREGGEGGGSRRSRSAPAQGGSAPAPPPPPTHTVQHEGFLLRKRELDANRKSSNR